MKDGRPFTFARLWENWKDPESGEWLRTCTIITGAQIHPRMPVILPKQHHAAWLGETENRNLKELLLPTLPTRCACGKFRQGSIGAPSQKFLTIRFNPETRERSLDALQWGLIPYWAKDPKIANRTINARAKTVDKAPLFRQACFSSVRPDRGDWLIARMAGRV